MEIIEPDIPGTRGMIYTAPARVQPGDPQQCSGTLSVTWQMYLSVSVPRVGSTALARCGSGGERESTINGLSRGAVAACNEAGHETAAVTRDLA